jgi:hypothetical protein
MDGGCEYFASAVTESRKPVALQLGLGVRQKLVVLRNLTQGLGLGRILSMNGPSKGKWI